MANKDENKGANVGEQTPENGGQDQNVEVVTVKQKGGLGTAVKVGCGLLLVAAGTGLGWLLKGIFGGRDEDEAVCAENESPTEE